MNIARTLFYCGIFLLGMGCAKMPTQEMSDARLAIKAAQEAKAQIYVPEKLEKAEKSLLDAENNLEFGLIENARQNAIFAKDNALEARNIAIAIDHAETIWRAIAAMGYSTEKSRTLLERAKSIAQSKDGEQALILLEETHKEGKRMLNQIFLDKAKVLIDKAKAQESSLNIDKLAILKNAESAYAMGDGEKSFSLIILLSQ